jgi:hypothetical protein
MQFKRNVGRRLTEPDQLVTVTSVTTTLIQGLYATQVIILTRRVKVFVIVMEYILVVWIYDVSFDLEDVFKSHTKSPPV